MVLFAQERSQFFKPLNSKYRAVIVECLSLLYNRLYSANADYGESLRREQVLDIFEEALARAPVMDSGDDPATRFKTEREQAGWILNQLVDNGWLEKQVDQATLQSTFPFSRYGRLFTQSLVEVGTTQVRTRHRNTRNTLNALEAFISRGEVHDLLDAYEYSERIISDFTDVIAELEERKRELVRQVEAQLLVQQATDQFFEFMEKRFQPDVSVRLSADSVEKHRDAIHDVIARIRRKRKDFKRAAELGLRQMVPELVQGKHSVLYALLDTIETRMRNAADLMLPALRRALQSFTKRADIIIRQLTYLHAQKNNDVVEVCRQLASLSPEAQRERLQEAGETLASLKPQLVDPEQIRLAQKREERVVSTLVSEQQRLDEGARRELLVQNLLDQAFVIQNEGMKDYLMTALSGGDTISTGELPVNDARDLLAMAHAVEVAAQSGRDSGYHFEVIPRGTASHHPYFTTYDLFDIRLVEDAPSDSPES
ncbi:MAG: DUF5716 family protein [Ketobacteraceae bacterium]|nr:DUF5716 family protein [Ketobacteraceae bacterium]